MNASSPWRVVRFDQWIDPVFDQRLSREPDIRLDIAPLRADDARAWRILERAHLYQISAAKDELPAHWHATPALLQRCPDLICVSSTGAGFDTVDVDACTRAGIAVVSQIGANAPAGLQIGSSRLAIDLFNRRCIEGGHLISDVWPGHAAAPFGAEIAR